MRDTVISVWTKKNSGSLNHTVAVALIACCVVFFFSTPSQSGDQFRYGAAASTQPDRSSTVALGTHLPKRASVHSWHPFPLFGGEMTSIAIDPVDQSTVYVGSRGGGVFKSIDGGQSWQPARDGLTFFPIRSLAIDPADPNVLYAGTDYNGIWKTINGGESWFFAGNGFDTEMVVLNLVIDPQDPQTVHAGLAGGVAFSVGNVFRSNDGAETWVATNNGMVSDGGEYSNGVLSLAMDPDHPSTLWAGTTYEGVFQTTNSASDWSAVNEGVPFRPNSEFLSGISAIAVDHHRGGRPLAVIGGDLYERDDLEGWRQKSTGYGSLGFISSQLVVHATDDQRLYAASGGLSVSIDAGVTWQDIHGGCDHVAVDPAAVDRLYCTHDAMGDLVGGVHISTDGGDTWTESVDGLTAVATSAVAVDPTNENRLYAGGDGYLYRSNDGGMSWSRGAEDYGHGYYRFYLGKVEDIAVDPADPVNIWVAAFGGLVRSTDSGETLEGIDTDGPFVKNLAFSTTGLYAGTNGDGVIFTSDEGASWRQGTSGFPTFGPGPCPVLSLAVDPDRPGTVWAGTQYGGGLVRSTDGGQTWLVTGLTDHNFVDAVAVNPGDGDDILAAAGSWDGGIYRSRDGGLTWEEAISGIAYTYDFAFDPNNPGHVYAATDGYGVLRSTDGGSTWEDFSDGIFHTRLLSLDLSRTSPARLIAGSLGSGLYWIDLNGPELVRRPSGRRLP